jgi:hypothetical protein
VVRTLANDVAGRVDAVRYPGNVVLRLPTSFPRVGTFIPPRRSFVSERGGNVSELTPRVGQHGLEGVADRALVPRSGDRYRLCAGDGSTDQTITSDATSISETLSEMSPCPLSTPGARQRQPL